MANAVLQLKNITKKYGNTLGVGPVEFDVEKGEFLTLLGPSGCGKTTTLHIIAGLLFPTEGTVLMEGRDITKVDPPYRDMGLVFQNYALFPHKTIYDNVAFGLRMRKVPKAEIRERVMRVLDVVGLPGVEERLPSQLSGGQRQRVALARAVVIEPTVLLLDEPLSNLDAVLRKRMRLELRDIQQKLGITTIFVTHDQDEAFEMSDRVVLMNRGRIEQLGPPEEMYDLPDTRFAAEFIGETNLIEGRVVSANGSLVNIEIPGGIRMDARKGNRDFGVGDDVFLMVRPERVDIRDKVEGETGMAASVAKRVFSGDLITFTLTTRDGIEFVSTKPSVERFRHLGPGDDVWVVPEDCRVLPRDN
ncbi:Spermidine/putrescine import ATP-binding protein PotA [Oceanibacterium hippocampi]|uniref:Spermidine/putrescine import ATP-binding protein PotA n=1 Tax=Oceanibacterium hippocampi TaxID=745714 RepID=A0A1Y5TJ39_9PROT|nr:Spermidine/putrescine import ATP-binding protein PotA [Oceanibacterium hippocampi]